MQSCSKVIFQMRGNKQLQANYIDLFLASALHVQVSNIASALNGIKGQ